MFDNKLDVLDSMLKATGHEKWGWHIYRCTYSSDDDWSAFMEKLRTTTQSTIEFYGGTCRAVAKQHIFTVVEDRERLENATKSDVCSMFRDWVNSPEAAAEQPNAKTSLSVAPMARYLHGEHGLSGMANMYRRVMRMESNDFVKLKLRSFCHLMRPSFGATKDARLQKVREFT
jgi:hypothetical protein